MSLGRGGSNSDELNVLCKEKECVYLHLEAHKYISTPFRVNSSMVEIIGCTPSVQCVTADAALIVVKQDLKMETTGIGSVLGAIGKLTICMVACHSALAGSL